MVAALIIAAIDTSAMKLVDAFDLRVYRYWVPNRLDEGGSCNRLRSAGKDG